MPLAEESRLALALKVGAKRGLNVKLGNGGDGLEVADVSLDSRMEQLQYNDDGSIDLYIGAEAPEGKGSFTGLLTLHGVTRSVTGAVDVRRAGADLRVNASFPVELSNYGIPKPRYLGVGVRDTVQVEVAFAVSR